MNAAAESRSATSRGHRNAPLTPEGRLRLCLRVDAGRPIAHVAAEAGISRRCLAKWYARWCARGENGRTDRSSRPIASPNRTSEPDQVQARPARRTAEDAGHHRGTGHRAPSPRPARAQPPARPRSAQRRAIARSRPLRARPGAGGRGACRWRIGCCWWRFTTAPT
ncbi:leucine zipper domain-containing protein [Streptomyces sp. NPDC003015]